MTCRKSQAIMAVTVILYYCVTQYYITCSNSKVPAFLRNFLPPSLMKKVILPTNHMKFFRFNCNSLGYKPEGWSEGAALCQTWFFNSSFSYTRLSLCLLYIQISYYSEVKAYSCTHHKMTVHSIKGCCAHCMKTMVRIMTYILETWALCTFYVLMTSHYSVTGSHHHSTGQWPLSTRQPFLFHQTFLKTIHLLTHIKREYPLTMNLLVCHQMTLFTKFFITHHSKMTAIHCVSAYVLSDYSVH